MVRDFYICTTLNPQHVEFSIYFFVVISQRYKVDSHRGAPGAAEKSVSFHIIKSSLAC